MIVLSTNKISFWNDISEEIRLFCGLTPVVAPMTEGADLPVGDGETTIDIDVSLFDDVSGRYALAVSGTHSARFDAAEETGDALIDKRNTKRALKSAAFHLMRSLYPSVSTPWGSLTGIRPTKLFRELTLASDAASARNAFLSTFDVSAEKTALAEEICSVQSPYISSVDVKKDIDLYIGIPFCKTRCLYCSFASEVIGKEDKLTPYLRALHDDIAAGAELCADTGRKVRNVYFGGGTPTVLSAEQLNRLLRCIRESYGGFGTEITVEAGRPDTITSEKLAVMREYGVERISVNPQTMNDETLKRIGRTHTAREIVEAYEMARSYGFRVINMDLIAGLPGETPDDFEKTLAAVTALKPENLTVHSLAIKRSSRLKQYLELYPLPSSYDTERMIDMGREAATAMGMRPYYMYRQKYMSGNLENTGYALPGTECVYNIDMMEETVSIMAHGGSGISKRVFNTGNRVERIPNPKEVRVYIEKQQTLQNSKRSLFTER